MSVGAVSLVVTVRDEAASIDGLLTSIAAQRRQPDEVVVADGGSTDGTWERLQTWRDRLPLVALQVAGANISAGRNAAIRAVRGDVVAVTDAGVRLDERWLERLLDRLDPDVDVVAGFFRADPRTTFEVAMGATVLPAVQDIRPERFLPSSRSVLFRRSAWEAVGGYPEWLDYCEDLVFDLALKRRGCRFAVALDAVAWFRPRSSLSAYWKQYFAYARGDGKADLWRRRHAIRYATYLGACVALAQFGRRPLAWLVLALGAALYTRRPYQRLASCPAAMGPRDAAAALALVPVIRLVGDLAKMSGYPAGVAWRLRRRKALV